MLDARHALLASLLALTACRNADQLPRPSSTAASTAGAPAAAPAEPPALARCASRGPRRVERASVPGASSSLEIVRAGDRLVVLVADDDERALHAVDAASMEQIGVT